MNIKQQLQNKIIELKGDIILIHSDIRHGFEISIKNEEDFFTANINELKSLKTDLSIWMPTFNYDFCKGKTYDVSNTQSQVGALTEYFRKNVAEWRTPVPVFPFAGIGEKPIIDISDIIDPFGIKSVFQLLFESDALLLHYGSPFHSSTIIHYAERISNRLSYRYDKIFSGKVIYMPDKEIDVKLNYHVRPLKRHLDYNWDNIENDLIENQILFVFSEGRSKMSLCKIKALVDYWKERIEEDPLYLLDNESKMWVEPLLDKLGRPFQIYDFE